MEFVATLLLLYLMQCASFLPRESVLFSPSLRRWRIRTGPGWRLLPLLPAANWVHTQRFPFRLSEGRLRSVSNPSRFRWGALDAPAEAVEPGLPMDLKRSGKLLRIARRPFYLAYSQRAAAQTAMWLQALEGSSPRELRGRVASLLAGSLSPASFRRDCERFGAAAGLLGQLSNLYLAFLFLGIPLLILLVHEERGLQIAFIAILLLHIVTLVAMSRAQRQLLPERPGERFERLLSAAFYPPLLLRAYADLRVDLLGSYHPAVAAATVLPSVERIRFLRAELLRLERDATASAKVDEIPELERAALLAMLEECGETRETLMRAQHQNDKIARAYCPACASDYIRFKGNCSDCGVALVPYPAEPTDEQASSPF